LIVRSQRDQMSGFSHLLEYRERTGIFPEISRTWKSWKMSSVLVSPGN